MAEEISKPLCEAHKVTMVSSGGGEVGAAKLSGEVLDIMTRLPEAVEKLTGVSISQVTHAHMHSKSIDHFPYNILYFTGLAFSGLTDVMSNAKQCFESLSPLIDILKNDKMKRLLFLSLFRSTLQATCTG